MSDGLFLLTTWFRSDGAKFFNTKRVELILWSVFLSSRVSPTHTNYFFWRNCRVVGLTSMEKTPHFVITLHDIKDEKDRKAATGPIQ